MNLTNTHMPTQLHNVHKSSLYDSHKVFGYIILYPFYGANDTTVLDSRWYLLWVSKPDWSCPIHTWWKCIHVTLFLRFTSSTTPTNLLVVSMAISSTYLWAGMVGLNTGAEWHSDSPWNLGTSIDARTRGLLISFPSFLSLYLSPQHLILYTWTFAIL